MVVGEEEIKENSTCLFVHVTNHVIDNYIMLARVASDTAGRGLF